MITSDDLIAQAMHDLAETRTHEAATAVPDRTPQARRTIQQAGRRRMVLTAAIGAAAAVAVGAVAVGTTFLNRPEPVDPADPIPMPAPTQDVTPTPEPAPTPTGTTEAEVTRPVTEHPLLPSALPLPDGLLATTDASWVLASFWAQDYDVEGSAGDSPTVLYLVDPAGTRYEVPVPDAGIFETVEDWAPGGTRAVLNYFTSDGIPSVPVVVDLETGAVLHRYPTPEMGDVPWIWSVRLAAPELDQVLVIRDIEHHEGRTTPTTTRESLDGRVLETLEHGTIQWRDTGDAPWAFDPERERIATMLAGRQLVTIDLRDGRRTPVPGNREVLGREETVCDPRAWLGPEELLVGCWDEMPFAVVSEEYHRRSLAGAGAVLRAGNEDSSMVGVAVAGEAALVHRWGCPSPLSTFASDASSRVDRTLERQFYGVAGGRLLTGGRGCGEGESALVGFDLANGSGVELLPRMGDAVLITVTTITGPVWVF